MHFKPAVAAPGGDILSLWPVPLGGFAVASGTSMATPFFAGTAALLVQAKGKSVSLALSARDLFQTTANPVVAARTDGAPLHTVTQQGAGLINAYKAVHTTTIVTPGELLLNDTAHFAPEQVFFLLDLQKAIWLSIQSIFHYQKRRPIGEDVQYRTRYRWYCTDGDGK
jgi:hypothetical protein